MLLVAAGILVATANTSGAYDRPGPTFLVSVSSTGRPANGTDWAWAAPVISANGRYVAFSSDATNLVPGDTNGAQDVFVRDLRSGHTRLASVGLGGMPAISQCFTGSFAPSISASGRYVVFSSCAKNLVAGETQPNDAVFVRDLRRGVTSLVSVSNLGVPSGGDSGPQAISGDGRYVVFTGGLDLALPKVAPGLQVYLRDLRTKTTSLVSTSSGGSPGDDSSGTCANRRFTGASAGISSDGTHVVFQSLATNLTSGTSSPVPVVGPALDHPAGPNPLGISHIFVKDLRTNKTAQADVNDHGISATPPPVLQACYPSTSPMIDAHGRSVSFESSASNLLPDPGHNWPFTDDAFVHDFHTGRTERVDVTSAGENPRSIREMNTGDNGGQLTTVSLDGRYVGFESLDSGLNPRGVSGSFLHDTRTGVTEPVPSKVTGTWAGSTPTAEYPYTIDGRSIVFLGTAHQGSGIFLRDLGPALGVGGVTTARGSANSEGALDGASYVSRPAYRDLFLRVELRWMGPSTGVPTADAAGLVYGVDFTANGHRYEVRAQRVPGPDYDPAGGASFGLFERDPATGLYTDEVGALRGGYGTTGEEVVCSVPLRDIGLEPGRGLQDVRVFSGIGSYRIGVVTVLDSMRVS